MSAISSGVLAPSSTKVSNPSEKLLAKFLQPQANPDVEDFGYGSLLDFRREREERSTVIAGAVHSSFRPWVAALAEYEQEQPTGQRRLLTRISEFLDKEEERRLRSLEIEFEAARRDLQNDYDRLMPKAIRSAAPMEADETGSPESAEPVPRVLIQQGPITHAELASGPIFLRPAKQLYHCLFGRLPRVRMLHPYWAPLRHLVRLVDRAAENGARNVLIVGAGVADGIADHLPGVHARLSLAETLARNLDKAFDHRAAFDLCICSLTIPESSSVPEIIKAVTPHMRIGGRIIVFLSNLELNHDLRSDPNLLRVFTELPTSLRVYFAGGSRSARILRRSHNVTSSSYFKRLLMFFLVIAPQAIAANWEEAATSEAPGSSSPAHCTSVTIEIEIGPPQSEAWMARAEVLSLAE